MCRCRTQHVSDTRTQLIQGVSVFHSWSLNFIGKLQGKFSTICPFPNSLINCHLCRDMISIYKVEEIRESTLQSLRDMPLIIMNEVFARSFQVGFHPIWQVEKIRDRLAAPIMNLLEFPFCWTNLCIKVVSFYFFRRIKIVCYFWSFLFIHELI